MTLWRILSQGIFFSPFLPSLYIIKWLVWQVSSLGKNLFEEETKKTWTSNTLSQYIFFAPSLHNMVILCGYCFLWKICWYYISSPQKNMCGLLLKKETLYSVSVFTWFSHGTQFWRVGKGALRKKITILFLEHKRQRFFFVLHFHKEKCLKENLVWFAYFTRTQAEQKMCSCFIYFLYSLKDFLLQMLFWWSNTCIFLVLFIYAHKYFILALCW